MTTFGLRMVAVLFSAIGGGIGAVATQRQIKEGNERRIQADKEEIRNLLGTREDRERARERIAKNYETVDGEYKEVHHHH